MSKQIESSPIQDILPIKDIKEDVIILKNNSLRSVLMTSSINFDLKSYEEQQAIISKFQGVVNSFDFDVQIMIASREFDISPYVEMLNYRKKEQSNELLRVQTEEYINYIQQLTEITNVMNETFYVVVPYNVVSVDLNKANFLTNLFGKKKKNKEKPQDKNFIKNKAQLWQRVDFTANILRGLGLKAAPLNTEELTELLYRVYNPGSKGGLEIKKTNEMRI